MADLKFNCPHCKRSLEAPEEVLGQETHCPSCNGTITLPNPEPKIPAPPPSPPPSQTKACPFCGEAILLAAIKCRHCGEFLDGRNGQAAAAPPPQPEKPKLPVETDIWKGNPSYLYYLDYFIFGALLLPLFGLGLLFILYALLDRSTRLYTLTNKRVISKAGIVSRQIHEVGVRDIRNINVKQGILERLLGLGTVEIASAGTTEVEISFVGIKNPMRARDLIRREKDEADNRD